MFPKNTMQRNGSRGFTLIELLVVIAIIGMLAVMVVVNLRSTTTKGRDARRVGDLNTLKLALELYYEQFNQYPPSIAVDTSGAGAGKTALVDNNFISVVPRDPGNGRAYNYVAYQLSNGTNGDCQSYHLGATLETPSNNALTTDVDADSPPTGYVVCGAGTEFTGSAASGAKCASGDYGNEGCYDIRP